MGMILAIFAGGGLGSVLRHFATLSMGKLFGDGFPYGTLFVNVLGCFLIGLLVEGFALKFQLPAEMRALVVTGFLGGFTTFSAFSLDFFKLAETGHLVSAVVYAATSFALSILAVFAGVFLLRGVIQ